jgi:hypothetical protein
MARQIIKQPNGKYCIFSTVVDDVVATNMSEYEVIEEYAEEARADIEAKVKGILLALDMGKQPYHQFTKTFDEMQETIEQVHGPERSQEVKTATT